MTFRNIRAGAAVVAVGALLAAYAGAAGADPGPTPSTYKQVTFKDQGVKIQQFIAATNMTKDQDGPARAFTSPTSMLVKPGDPRIVVAATADMRNKTCYLTVSKDAGHTWHFSKELPTDPKYPYCTTNSNAGVPLTMIAWGRNNTLYYAHLAYGEGEGPGAGLGKGSIIVARTTDLGSTWKSTLVDNNRGSTANPPPNDTGVSGLAVDTSGPRDVVYVGFNQGFPDAAADSLLRLPHVMVATSTDGGATFGKPVDLNTFNRPTYDVAGKTYQTYMMASFGSPFLFAKDGILLAVSGSTFGFNDQPAPPPEAGAGLSPGSWYAYPMPQFVARSTDQGKTWTISKLGEPVFLGTGAMTGLGWTPDGGPKGTILAVYNATPQTSPSMNLEDIVMQRSTDMGVTWSGMQAIDDDPPELNATGFYPQLNVAPNGRVDVAWQDNRDATSTDFRFDVRYTYSTDGGLTWAKNVKVNDRPLNFNFGISYNSDLRYPNGVASANEYAMIGWADTRNATELTQAQDNYAAAVQFAPLPTTKNTTAPVIAAIFGGLVLAGLVLLVVLLVRRGSGGSTPAAPRKATAAAKT